MLAFKAVSDLRTEANIVISKYEKLSLNLVEFWGRTKCYFVRILFSIISIYFLVYLLGVEINQDHKKVLILQLFLK